MPLKKSSIMVKRLFDLFFSGVGLLVLFPFFIITAILIKLEDYGPVFFRQERIGKNFRSFKIFKFRTMIKDASIKGPLITVAGDKRVTKVGKYLRNYKIDELPQLINVFIGNMSLVGPRPEVKQYVELFKKDYQKILSVRPGITDLASITFSDEERILLASTNWEKEYIEKVLPEKIRLALTYVENPSLLVDVKLIFQTLLKIIKF